MAAVYVVDALEPDELQEFESHLSGCPQCQQEVHEMQEVTEELSRAVQAAPPPSLRAAVMSQLAQTAQAAPPTEAAAPLTEPGQPLPTNVTALRPRRSSRLPYLVAAAALLVAIGFGGWAVQSHRDVSEANSHYAEIAQLLAAPDVRTAAGSVAGGGSGTVVLSDARGRAVFVAAGMPTLAGGKVYELWTVTKAPVPAGTFTPGAAPALVDLPDAALSAARILVTVEPSGGSEHPTSTPVMSVALPGSA